MDSYVFDIILITFAIVVLLHLFYNNNLFVSHREKNVCNENMENHNRDEGTYGLDRMDKSKPWYHVANKLVTEEKKIDTKCDELGKITIEKNYDGNLESETYDINLERRETLTDHKGNVCSLGNRSGNMKRYIREYVLDGNAQCGCVVDKSKSDFTRDEVDDYREKQLRFESEKINGTSSPAIDPVDKVNQLTLHEGKYPCGQKIADFYDKLIDNHVPNMNDLDNYTKTTKCIKPPHLDISQGVPDSYYTETNNNYILRDNWMYVDEKPNNGGYYFDNIKGSDPMMTSHRMVD